MIKVLPVFLVALATAVTPAFGQSLQVTASVNGAFTGVTQGGSVVLTANSIGQVVQSTVTVRYAGATSATITGLTLTGASSMTLGPTSTPVTLTPNGITSFTIQYVPTAGNSVTGLMAISYTEGGIASSFSFFVNGSSADLAFTVFFSPDGATANLTAGQTISFPTTNVGASVSAVINILNRGFASGSLASAGVSGADYQITSSPAPATILAGQQVSLTVVFTPRATGTSAGLLTLGLSNGNVSFPLSGLGAAPNFAVTYALSDGNVRALSDGTAISFPAVDVNAATVATVTIANQGTGTGSFAGLSVTGTGFLITGAPQVPSSILPGQSARFNIVFNPTRTGSFTGTFRIDLTGRSISGTLAGATAASNFSVSYIDPDTSSTIPLPANATLSFPNTLVGAASTITVAVANSGAGTGSVNSVSLGSSNSAFQLVTLPPMPVSVPPSQQLRFGVRFSPKQQQSATDTLFLDLNGQITSINLQGQGTQAQFTYGLSGSTGTTALDPNGTAALSDTTVGQTSSVVVTIVNSGLGDGSVAGISVTGQGISLSDLPGVPFTLRPNGTQHFTLNFSPTQPGAITGRLTIGADSFTITATGIGSRLIYSYTSAATPVPVTEGGVVIFAPQAVGSTGTLNFSVQNTGTSAITISSINLAAPSTVFPLSQLPALPFNLNAGATTTFAIGFVPNNTGSLTATLRVNNSSFTLSGNGTQPAALPAYRFQGPSGTQQPAQQPALGLVLNAPYPSALQGTLKLAFISSVFTDDTSIQFANGGRTVNFTIPANSTQALFSGNATTVALQTGTTAGNIEITPSFALQTGFDLTPASPDILTLTIQRTAPQLLNAAVSGVTLSSFAVALNGYSTTRAIRQLDIQLTPKAGQSFATTHLTIDVTSASSAWFQSAASQGFGGSFLVAIPFVLSNGNSSTDLVHLLQSLSITATNDVGGSNAITVAIP